MESCAISPERLMRVWPGKLKLVERAGELYKYWKGPRPEPELSIPTDIDPPV
jgi:hypothetical protein